MTITRELITVGMASVITALGMGVCSNNCVLDVFSMQLPRFDYTWLKI